MFLRLVSAIARLNTMLQIYGCVRFKTWLPVYFWLIYLFERRSVRFKFQNFVRNICSLKIMLAKSFATPHQENSINALRLPRVSASQLLAIQQLLLIRNNIIRLFRAKHRPNKPKAKKSTLKWNRSTTLLCSTPSTNFSCRVFLQSVA